MFLQFDCIITTNWDTLAERILLKHKKWHPSEGYGFQVPLVEDIEDNNLQLISLHSDIKILKLHGSIGWHEKNETLYLSQPKFLQYLLGHDIRDQNAPRVGSGPDENPLILKPSYLKQLDHPTLLSIWDQARLNLEKASSITIVGYSLPKADVAIRALLLPIRNSESSIRIINPFQMKDDFKKRWEDFFKPGKLPIFENQRASEYFI